MTTTIPTETVRDAARGQWLSILGHLAPELGPAIQRVGRHVPCPVHGGRDGFRLFRDAGETGGAVCNTCGEHSDGFAVLMWLNGWTFPEAKQAVADFLRIEPGADRLPPPVKRERPARPETPPEETEARLAKLKEVWSGTKADNGTLATYLKSRGLYLPAPKDLRLHPALPYYDQDGKLMGTYPAMIAKVQASDGERVCIHRTYLNQGGNGKAPVESPKKLLRPVRDGALMGGAIRLTEAGETLALAEGIETALAVREACQMEGVELPIWATVSAGGMEAVKLPETVKRVEIWADHDKSGRGQDAAEILAGRLHAEGREVYVYIPPIPGTDWLDVLKEHGHRTICEARELGRRWAPTPSETTDPERPKRSISVRGRDDYRDMDIRTVKRLPPVQWLVKDILPKPSLAVIYGPSGGGKSFSAVDIGMSVASGRRWFTGGVTQGPVVYVAAEGAPGLGKRIESWQIDRMMPSDDVPFFTVDQPVRLMNRESVLRFIEAEQRRFPSLVILDTLARCMDGGDENSTRDMNVVIGNLDLIKDALHCTVLVVHHTNKGGTVERGSGALRGASDAMISFIPEGEVISLAVDKQKDGAMADPFQLRLCPVLHTDSCVLMPAELSEGTGELTKDQRTALKRLARFRDAGASRRDWMEASELGPGRFADALDDLVSKGLVYEPGPDDKPKRYRVMAAGHDALR